jgi:hypothetical protein
MDAGPASPTDDSLRTGCTQELTIMNKLALSTLLIASALSFNALAGNEVPTFPHERTGAAKARAEVVADLQQARLAGKHFLWTDSLLPEAPVAYTPRTRAEVLAELRDAQATGEYAALHADEPVRVTVKRPLAAQAMAGQVTPEAH